MKIFMLVNTIWLIIILYLLPEANIRNALFYIGIMVSYIFVSTLKKEKNTENSF